MQLLRWTCGLCVLFAATLAISADEGPTAKSSENRYTYATGGVRDQIEGGAGAKWKLLVDESTLGGREMELAEVVIPAGTVVRTHSHGAVEIIYVLAGTYGHEVNGKLYRLQPGMVGIVRPGDKTRHIASKAGETRLLIMWSPPGEAARLLPAGKGTAVPPLTPVESLDP